MRAASRWIAIIAVASAPWIFGCSDSSSGGDCGPGPGDDGPHDAPNADAPSDASGDGMKADGAIDGATDAPTVTGDAANEGATDAAIDTGNGATDAATDRATDAGGGLGDADASTTTVSAVRVANWSPDSPAVDFCLALHGTGAFQGPVVARLANAGGADATVSAALAFPQVSAYSYVAPGTYDARLVVAGAADCSTGIGADATTLPALGPGAFETIALVGEAQVVGTDPGLQMVGFLDDQRPSGMVALRWIQAVPAIPKVDMGMGLVGNFKPMFLGVPFGHASTSQEAAAPDGGAAPAVDANGYATLQALSAVTLSAHAPSATQDSATASNVSAGAGSVLTIVLVGRAAGTAADAGVPGQFVECVDNAGTVGAYANCSVISQ